MYDLVEPDGRIAKYQKLLWPFTISRWNNLDNYYKLLIFYRYFDGKIWQILKTVPYFM